MAEQGRRGHVPPERLGATGADDRPGAAENGGARIGGSSDHPAHTNPTPRRKRALPLETVSAGMLVREVSVRPPDVVFVKGLLEASDGLAAVFAERGGELTLVAPQGRDAELEELLADLVVELGAVVRAPAGAAR